MKFELKNIKHFDSLSRETYCYSATLYINGKRSYTVENSGSGGSDMIRQITGVTPVVSEAQIDAYFKSLPGYQRLEFHCAGLVTEWLEAKDLKALLKKSVVGVLGGKVYGWKKTTTDIASLKHLIELQNKGVVFLDDVPFDVALKMYLEAK